MFATAKRGARILVVDDEEFVRDCVVDILSSAGYEVDPATSGVDAFERVRRLAYDAVVTDVMMPKLGGVELHARVCKEHPKMRDSFVFVTGDRTQAGRVPPYARLLFKPFMASELIEAVRGVLGEHVAKRREERYTWTGECLISVNGGFEPLSVAATVSNISAHGFNVLYRGNPLKADTPVDVKIGEIGIERRATVRWSERIDGGAAAGLLLSDAVPARLIAGQPWSPKQEG